MTTYTWNEWWDSAIEYKRNHPPDTDAAGSAGVREPRKPLPSHDATGAALSPPLSADPYPAAQYVIARP